VNLYECPRIDDAAGYVLCALPDSEAESYRHHVTECQECAAKVEELGFVSHALYSAAPQLSAPPEIFDRVMAVVRAESELLQAAGAGADRPVRQEDRARWGIGFARLRPLTAGVLAASLIALGLGAGAVLRGGDASCTTRPATVDPSAGARASGELKICDGSARLALTGMQAPPDGRIYELWLDDPADRQGPKPAGLFSVRDGSASVDVGSLRGKRTVLVTHEPLPGGSEVPTRTPIVKAST
jgi:Anti-sigma-K factor rskA